MLLDRLRFVHYRRLREALLRSLVNSIHHQHPEAVLNSRRPGNGGADYRSGISGRKTDLIQAVVRLRFSLPKRDSTFAQTLGNNKNGEGPVLEISFPAGLRTVG